MKKLIKSNLKPTRQEALEQKIKNQSPSKIVTARGLTRLGNPVCKTCLANKQLGILNPPVHPNCRCRLRKNV